MDPKVTQALLDYEELKIQEKEIAAKLDELKPIILPAMNAETKLQGQHGTFELKEKTVWKFASADIIAEESRLKAMKEEAIAKGTAVKSITTYIEYRKAKE